MEFEINKKAAQRFLNLKKAKKNKRLFGFFYF